MTLLVIPQAQNVMSAPQPVVTRLLTRRHTLPAASRPAKS